MFYSPESFRTFSRFIIVFCIFLLLVLGVVEYFPLYADYPSFINQAGLQRTRTEVLASSMLTLEYRPLSEHANAISTIEITLPLFKQEQTILQNDPAPDVQSLMLQTQPTYLAIITAAQTVVNNPNQPIDPVQVSIVVMKRDTYRSIINQIVTILVHHEENSARTLFYIKTSIILLLIVIGCGYWAILEKRMKHVIMEEKAKASER